MTRLTFAGIALLVIAAGLLLRLVPWGLPLALHHAGGGLLWGGMVYALVVAVRPIAWKGGVCLLAALGIIAAVEFSRLLHGPALDAFRLTLAGQLLLGRIFSAPNILTDGLGAATVMVATSRLLRESHGGDLPVRTAPWP